MKIGASLRGKRS